MNWRKLLGFIFIVIFVVILNFLFPPAITIFTISELFTACTLALLICFLPISFTSSELFSKLGTYHQLSADNSPFGETGLRKLIKVYILELQLSVLIFIVIFFLSATIIQFKENVTAIDIFNVIIASAVICPAFLLSLRLLSNPVKKIPRWQGWLTPLNWIFPVHYLARPDASSQTIRLLKERFVSFYFSLIASVLFTLIFIYVYFVIVYNTAFFNKIRDYFVPAILSLNLPSVIMLMIIFLITLFITTLIGESFLKKYEVMEIDYEFIQKPLIVDHLNLLFKWLHVPIELNF